MNIVGKFELGYEFVLLTANPTKMGGSFCCLDKEYQAPCITVGLDYDQFDKVVGVLFHEALEFSLTRFHARFSPSLELAGDHSAYLFSFNHVVLSEVSMMVAEYVMAALPQLREAWENRSEAGL